MSFYQKLNNIINRNNSLLCVGLDPDVVKFPYHIKSDKIPLYTFCKSIVDATYNLVCAYKPNSAFFEAEGAAGINQFQKLCHYIRKKYPQIPIIIDAKRGDIGNSNEKYAKYVFEYLNGDAVTVQPYAGRESLVPFLSYKDRGIFVLCKTSNPGAGEFQDLLTNHEPLYQTVAKNVSGSWNTNHNCALVVGATYPKELEKIRYIVKDMPILIPGVGTQGGDLEKVLASGLTKDGIGLIINVSRNIIYASSGTDFAKKAKDEAFKYRKAINLYRKY